MWQLVLLSGQDLWVLSVGHSPRQHVHLRPNVKYIGTIHGNEVAFVKQHPLSD